MAELSAFLLNDERKGKAVWGLGRERAEKLISGKGMREDSNRRGGEGGGV